ncbi:MAG: hypothetical protein HC919_08510 [Oscillatoriales cyanobacterium SM2_2_1]|nr:hypothetical protein [Oscillatoriales cyanobacterium SM2_2_1]
MDTQYTLLLGFSYSLAPDGSPGSYNQDIATAIRQWIAERGSVDDVLLAAQWEIVDALTSQQSDVQPFAVSPPTFTASDVLDANRLAGLLRAGETAGARELAQLLLTSLGQVGYELDGDAKLFDRVGLNAERLTMHLNGLLSDSTMYQRFRPNVELHDLHRTLLGALGFEARQMPLGESPLLPFQAMRVNRLIIEAVVPYEDILKRGTYLSTDGVLDQVLERYKDKLASIRHVCVFGFPGHSPRCRRQTIESFWRVGRRDIGVQDVEDVHAVPRDAWKTLPWDSTTAQIWCRNLRNWLDYEAMGLRRR